MPKSSFFRVPASWVVAAVLAGISTFAAATQTVVYPTGSHPDDIKAVQAAVAMGGIVQLKAVNRSGKPMAFDFGSPDAQPGTVELTRDVRIRGEQRGQWRTTIRGGYPAFTGVTMAQSVISGIHFDAPKMAALYLLMSSGMEFTDNLVTDVVGFPWFENDRKGQAIWVLAADLEVITGKIKIARNKIFNIDAEDGIGLALVGFHADVEITGNEIRGTNFVGILVFEHVGRVTIEKNIVIPGPERFPGFYSVGNGIQIGPISPGVFDRPTEPVYIADNDVICENANADCILLFPADVPLNHSVITRNRVWSVDTSYGGITLADNVSYTLVAGNRVRGGGAYAIDIVDFFGIPGAANRGNMVLANDVSRFDDETADLYLGPSADGTVVVGCHGTILDEGENSFISCRRP